MRQLAGLIASILMACMGAMPAAAQTGPNRIEVVFRPDTMFYSLEDTGAARFRVGDEDYSYTVSPEEFAQVRDLLETYRAEGLVCDDPAASPNRDGHIHWSDGRGEVRRPNEGLCYTNTYAQRAMASNQAFRLMYDWGKARWTPPPGLPAPTSMTLIWKSWGNRLVEWTIPRGGEGRYINRDGEPVTFPVSEAQFDEFRALFAPYEGAKFECRRAITDGAYGSVIWSQPGHEDQALNFDAGCVTGDASDVFERLERAEAMLNGLRDAD